MLTLLELLRRDVRRHTTTLWMNEPNSGSEWALLRVSLTLQSSLLSELSSIGKICFTNSTHDLTFQPDFEPMDRAEHKSRGSRGATALANAGSAIALLWEHCLPTKLRSGYEWEETVYLWLSIVWSEDYPLPSIPSKIRLCKMLAAVEWGTEVGSGSTRCVSDGSFQKVHPTPRAWHLAANPSGVGCPLRPVSLAVLFHQWSQ